MERGTREYAHVDDRAPVRAAVRADPGAVDHLRVAEDAGVDQRYPETANLGDRFLPTDLTFDNYEALFSGGIDDSPFIKPLINSILIALITTSIAIVLAAFAAYAIARLDFPGKALILAGALAIAMFPAISTVGPLFDMWRTLGLYDTYLGLIIPYLTFSLPLAIYTLVAFFREIPWDLEQAAQVDGATPFQAFRKVIVPLAAPGVFTAAILVFIFCWNDFLFAITLTSSDASRTVPAALAFFTGESPVHRADRQHRRRGGDRHHADHHLRVLLPAPDRRRPDRGRREGMNKCLPILLLRIRIDGKEVL